MQPVPDWRRRLRHAWSIRFAALSVVFGSVGAGLDLIDPVHRMQHPALIPLLGTVCALAAGAATLISQKKLGDRR